MVCFNNIGELHNYIDRVADRMMQVTPDRYPVVYKNWVKVVPNNRISDFNFVLKNKMLKRGLRWDFIEQNK